MTTDAERSALIEIERNGLSRILTLLAVTRETERDEAGAGLKHPGH